MGAYLGEYLICAVQFLEAKEVEEIIRFAADRSGDASWAVRQGAHQALCSLARHSTQKLDSTAGVVSLVVSCLKKALSDDQVGPCLKS